MSTVVQNKKPEFVVAFSLSTDHANVFGVALQSLPSLSPVMMMAVVCYLGQVINFGV